MPADTSLQALRDASPRNQPGFEESFAHYDTLRRQIAATPIPSAAPTPRVPRGRMIRLSTAAAAVLALAGVIVGMSVTATSPSSAFAAAKQALAATAAAVSGTMTMTTTPPSGAPMTVQRTLWNGSNIAFSTGGTHPLGPDRQLILIGGGAYVRNADGHWLHYASENEVGYKIGPEVELAHDNVAGNTAGRILDLATGLTKTEQPGGSTLYAGTIPNTTADPANDPADDALVRMITNLRTGIEPGAPRGFDQPESHTDLHLEMTVASDGRVRRLSVTFLRLDAHSTVNARPTTWTVTYSRRGGTPPVTAPPACTPGTPVIVTPSVAPAGPHGG
jgi:hypothetical protein